MIGLMHWLQQNSLCSMLEGRTLALITNSFGFNTSLTSMVKADDPEIWLVTVHC